MSVRSLATSSRNGSSELAVKRETRAPSTLLKPSLWLMKTKRFVAKPGWKVKPSGREDPGRSSRKSKATSAFVTPALGRKETSLPPSSNTTQRSPPGWRMKSTGLLRLSCGKTRSTVSGAGGFGEPVTREVAHGVRGAACAAQVRKPRSARRKRRFVEPLMWWAEF